MRLRLMERALVSMILGYVMWKVAILIMARNYELELMERFLYSNELGQSKPSCDCSKPIHILSWTSYNMHSNQTDEVWFGKEDQPSLDECYDKGYLPRDMKCVYTNDKSTYNISDVILFRGRKLQEQPLPAYRFADQKWVFWEFEPPYKVWMYANLTQYNGLFNLTATYSRDSDIPNLHDLNRMCVRNHKKYAKLAGVNYARKKRKEAVVAWMVSVCNTQSKREKYVKQMMKYIPVDVYGQCGSHQCGSHKQETWKVDQCDHRLFHGNNSYKFYLAFENSLCDDYVTEKLWRTQKLDSIPIVFGHVDYAKIMPRDSFVDIRDFASPKHLAAFLNRLDRNDKLYNKYVRNKNSLKCSLLHKYMPWHCMMCEKLHELRDTRKIIYNLGKFWGTRRCTSQQEFLRRGRIPDSTFFFEDT